MRPIRTNTRRNAIATTVLALFAFAATAPSASAQVTTNLIANGDFESGNFNGWSVLNSAPNGTVTNPNSRNFYLSTPGANTPTVNGNTAFATAANTTGGRFYAVSNSDFPGQSALYQRFTIQTGTINLAYSFQLFVNDQSLSGGAVDPSGLDYTTKGTFADNQHARVDILRETTTDLFSTNAADIAAILYKPGVDGANPAAYTTYSGTLNSLVAGQSYYFRVAEVDNLSALNLGIDNVRITATVAPEAGSLALTVLGIVAWGTGAAAAYRVKRHIG